MRAETYRKGLREAVGDGPVTVHHPTARAALRLVHTLEAVRVLPPRGFLLPHDSFRAWADGRDGRRLRQVDFYRWMRREPRTRLIRATVRTVRNVPAGAEVRCTTAEGCDLALRGRLVFDSRPVRRLPPARTTLLQHFRGWFVETATPRFDPGVPSDDAVVVTPVPRTCPTRHLRHSPRAVTGASLTYCSIPYKQYMAGYFCHGPGADVIAVG